MARGGDRRRGPQRDGGRDGRDRDGAPPLAATKWGRADGEDDTLARSNRADDAPRSRFDFEEAEDDDDRGRRRQQAASRSLLNAHREEAELPPASHRSVKEKKKKGERFNKREWVLDEENNLKRMQEEKAARARAKAAAEARKAREALEKDVYIPGNISVAQLADKFGVKVLHLQRKMIELGMSEEVRSSAFLLNADDATSLALEYNLNPIIDSDRGYDIYPEPEADPSTCPLRPPV
jgi:translation initiation factor IF-2